MAGDRAGRRGVSGAEAFCSDDLPDGLLVADSGGNVIVFNRQAARLTGMAAADALARRYTEVLPLRDADGRDWWRHVDPYGGLRTRVGHPERQLHLEDAEGVEGGRELLVRARYVREPERAGEVAKLVVSFRDAGHRVRQERDRANLVSTVAHELRSPLTSVKGFTATLLDKWGRFTDDQKRVMLETVNADADRVTRLITDLLDVSRIEAGRLEIRRQVVDLPAAVSRVFAGRVAAGEPEERFALDIRGELPEMWLDRDKIDQVLGNLVENAVSHGRGPVTVILEPADGGAAVSVRDHGEGVPAEMAGRIFRRFWRGGKRRGGTGLGLFIVKGLVEAHGGTITAGCAPDGGAQFRFELPVGTPDFVLGDRDEWSDDERSGRERSSDKRSGDDRSGSERSGGHRSGDERGG